MLEFGMTIRNMLRDDHISTALSLLIVATFRRTNYEGRTR